MQLTTLLNSIFIVASLALIQGIADAQTATNNISKTTQTNIGQSGCILNCR
ncbi:hypothetical protein [Nostoc sp. TCL26-01]|uniref:hypothetical protein n=1 Tax=Nostoc sp. TCL26-01 TaxID=2576904 RepID=UPI0015B88E58|nr:hypothetical protein [Nostoc sp. TCL26-01]